MTPKGEKQYPAWRITCEWCGERVWKSRPDARFCCTAHQQKAKRERELRKDA